MRSKRSSAMENQPTRNDLQARKARSKMMTPEDCIRKALESFDARAAQSLADYEALLRSHHATPQELKTELVFARADLVEERKRLPGIVMQQMREADAFFRRGSGELH